MRMEYLTTLKSTILGLGTVVGLTSGYTALAQTRDDQADDVRNDGVIEEIVVSATKRELSIQDVPINITAISGEDLEGAGISSSQDLLNTLPGVFASDQGGRSNLVNNISMRGLNANNPGENNLFQNITEAPVSTYLNDMPLFVNLKLTDIDRVEVLRGPQGTLYGSGSVGGTIRYILNKPIIGESEGRVSAGISTPSHSEENGYSVDGVVNIPLGDNLAARLVAGQETIAGVVDMSGIAQVDSNGEPIASADGGLVLRTAEDVDERSSSYFRGSLLAKPGDNLDFLLSFFYQKDDYDAESVRAITNVSTSSGPEYQNAMRFIAPGESISSLLSLEASVDLGFASLFSITSLSRTEADFVNDVSGLYKFLDDAIGDLNGYPRIVAPSYIDQSAEVLTQELRLVSNSENKIDWVVGIFLKDETREVSFRDTVLGYEQWADDTNLDLGVPLPPEFQNVAYAQDRTIDFEDISGFAEVTYYISDVWQITGGLRAFQQKFKQTNRLRFRYFGLDDTIQHDEDSSDFLFKFNTSFDIGGDSMVYFTWSEGFRHGGANAFPTTGPLAFEESLIPIEPDEVTNFELGLKGRLADGSMDYSLAAFRMLWDNVQLDTFLGPLAVPSAINGSEAESTGFELSLTKHFAGDFRINFGYAYVDASLSKDVDFNGDGMSGAFSNDSLAGVSKHTASVALDYERNITPNWAIVVHLDHSYRSDFRTTFNSSTDNYAKLDGFGVTNFSVSIEGERLAYGILVRNLTDEEGVTGVVNNRNSFAPFDSRAYVRYPTNIVLSASFNF